MIEEIKKKISDDNEILNILPQNNSSNKKKYLNKVSELLNEYTLLQKNIYNYISSKNSLLKNKYFEKIDDDIIDKIEDLEKKLYYFNDYQDSYEILGLDKLFYNLHKYYDSDLNFYNENINKILDIFEKAGVKVSKEDFYFSESAYLYMSVFLNQRNGTFDFNVLKETFENLFWKSHNMMRFILLNFKHLYYINEKKFNEYLKNERKNILNNYGNSYDNLLIKYQELITRRNNMLLTSKYIFYNMFMNKEINVKDFDSEKMEKLINSFLEEGFNPSDIKKLFMNFYASLKEEMFIYNTRFVLDYVHKIYQEKDNYKNLFSSTYKEIKSLEKEVLKKRKKINHKSIFKRKDTNDKLNNDIENILLELDEKYDLLDENRYKEKISLIDNSKVKDYYLIGKSYLFLKNNTKDLETINIDDVIMQISKNIYSPYNVLIENINYNDLDSLNLIVFDKYRLLGFNLSSDDLLSDNLDSLIKTFNSIIIYYCLNDLKINIDEIEFILESEKIKDV